MSLKKYISAQFRKPSGIAGGLSTFIMNLTNQRQYNAVISALSLSAGDTVLDIGFGNGYLLHRLAKIAPATFHGIDISEDMVRAATARNKKLVLSGQMHLQVGDVSKINLEDGFFDKVYTVNTVYFWQDIDLGLSEINRVLKPNGIFINAVYSKKVLDSLRHADYGYTKYTQAQLKKAAKQNGFEILEVIETRVGISYCYVLRKL